MSTPDAPFCDFYESRLNQNMLRYRRRRRRCWNFMLMHSTPVDIPNVVDFAYIIYGCEGVRVNYITGCCVTKVPMKMREVMRLLSVDPNYYTVSVMHASLRNNIEYIKLHIPEDSWNEYGNSNADIEPEQEVDKRAFVEKLRKRYSVTLDYRSDDRIDVVRKCKKRKRVNNK